MKIFILLILFKSFNFFLFSLISLKFLDKGYIISILCNPVLVAIPPAAGEPDPIVRRGLKRASKSDMEIAEICSLISDVNVNKEPHHQVIVMEFSDEAEWQAPYAELARLDEFNAKKDIPRDQAAGPQLPLHVGAHSEEWSTKLSVVSATFWSTIRKEQGVSVLPDAWTTDLQNVACSGCPSRLECEVFRCQQGFPAHTHQNSCVCGAARRVSESDSWRCLGNDQNCVWFGGGTG